jgi:hypothetical protein
LNLDYLCGIIAHLSSVIIPEQGNAHTPITIVESEEAFLVDSKDRMANLRVLTSRWFASAKDI